MGSLFSTQKQESTNQQTQSAPWGPQEAFLNQGFQTASNALNKAQGVAGPNNFVSQFTPEQLGAFGQMLKYGTGNPQIAQNSANAGGALTSAGANATGQGLFGLANYTPGNTPSAVLDAANSYANNPATQGMIDAATRDARRSVSEGVLPQIDRNAQATGNINSNRTGIAQGIVQRGLADNVADTSANIRGQMFNQGLTTAANQFGANDASRLGALSSLVSGGNAAVGTGVGANSGAVSQQGGLFNLANSGIAGQQQGAQAGLNDALARYGFGTSSPFAGLNDFWNVVGSNNWGGTSTGQGTKTTTGTPSIASMLGSGIGLTSSFMGGPIGGALGSGLGSLFGMNGSDGWGGNPMTNPRLRPI